MHPTILGQEAERPAFVTGLGVDNSSILLVPEVGVEPTRPQGPRDFESRTSTSSITPAYHFNPATDDSLLALLCQLSETLHPLTFTETLEKNL